MRRRLGFFIAIVGLVCAVIGAAAGCGALFSFNGRHPVAVHALVPGVPRREMFPTKAGRAYTLAVDVVFERQGLQEREGALVVDAAFPLFAAIEDGAGPPVAKITGWLDPHEPPTVLYGQSTNRGARRRTGSGETELVAERLLGPYRAVVDHDVAFVVDLGTDRLTYARVKEARAVVYDDALPTSVAVAFGAAGAGGALLLVGALLVLVGRPGARRGGARPRPIV